jgi:hypothetical protein
MKIMQRLIKNPLTILRAAARSPSSFDLSVQMVIAGIEAGSIRNADYQDAKSELSRAAERAWEIHVADRFFYGGKGEQQPPDMVELYDGIMILSLHAVISAAKKIAESKATGPAVDAMRQYCAEALPLAEAVASLKDKVAKGRAGRAPSAVPSKPENPNKAIKTCPVCFRPIAVVGGTMARHGYKRPMAGWQTASCPGVRFQPLEVSSEGLAWLISTLRTRLAALRNVLANPSDFMADAHNDRNRGSAKYAQRMGSIEAEIAGIENELPTLEIVLSEWKPESSKQAGRKMAAY